jgi:hypothetical protein
LEARTLLNNKRATVESKKKRGKKLDKTSVNKTHIIIVARKKLVRQDKLKRSQLKKVFGDYDSKTKHAGGFIEEVTSLSWDEQERQERASYTRCGRCSHRTDHTAQNCIYYASPNPNAKKSKSRVTKT